MDNSKEFFKNNLKLPLKTLVLNNTDSTNALCKRLSAEEKEDMLVVALSQSGGKGRLGRSFYSPAGTGIYMSFLLHPRLHAAECTKITTAAAVSAARAIDAVSGKNSLIKWVNDIYIGNKKVCGILTEGGLSGKTTLLDYAVLGIGLNLYNPKGGFPHDIEDKAGSVFGKKPPCAEKAVEFITAFTEEFFEIYNMFPHNSYMEEYRKRSMLNGKEVSFIKDGKEFFGTVESIDDNAALILKTENETVTLLAGEVSLKLQ